MDIKQKCIIAVDPGREKCGVAVLALNKAMLFHKTVTTKSLPTVLQKLERVYVVQTFVIGSGTTSKDKKKLIEETFPTIQLAVIDEYRTTDAARKRYWQENPPKGIKKFLPLGMLVPPVPVDDFAAVIIGERYLDAGKDK